MHIVIYTMDGGTWWAAVHVVAKSRTQLSDNNLGKVYFLDYWDKITQQEKIIFFLIYENYLIYIQT